jgi:hypothetical protein
VQEERRDSMSWENPMPVNELWGRLVRATGRYFLEGLVAAGTVFAGPSDYLATHDRA